MVECWRGGPGDCAQALVGEREGEGGSKLRYPALRPMQYSDASDMSVDYADRVVSTRAMLKSTPRKRERFTVMVRMVADCQ